MITTYEHATITFNGKPIAQAFDGRIEEGAKEAILPKLTEFSATITFEVKATRAQRRFFESLTPGKDPRWIRRERRHFERPPTRGYWKGCTCRGCKARKAVDAVRPAHVPPWEALARLAVGLSVEEDAS